MRTLVVSVLLTVWTAAAAAAELDGPDRADTSGYSARIYYRFDFGSRNAHAQSVGFRLDQDRAAARGMPAALQWSYAGPGATALTLNGIEIRDPGAGAMRNNLFDALTPGEWIAVGGTAIVVILLLGHGGGDGGVAGSGGS